MADHRTSPFKSTPADHTASDDRSTAVARAAAFDVLDALPAVTLEHWTRDELYDRDDATGGGAQPAL